MLKSIIIPLVIFTASNLSFAQNNNTEKQINNNESPQLKNELKLNLAYAPFGYLEATYERILPGNSSIGIAFGKSVKKDIDLNYHIIAFYRLFFGQQDGKGFFIEANGAFWREDTRFIQGNSNGIGLAMGGKFFRGPRFHGEFVFGYGRTITENTFDFSEAYPRFGISLGHRF